MNGSQEEEARLAEKAKEDACTKWHAKPETKLMISLLPALETDTHRESFAALIRSAFEAGHDAGGAATAASMIHSMLRYERGERRPR